MIINNNIEFCDVGIMQNCFDARRTRVALKKDEAGKGF